MVKSYQNQTASLHSAAMGYCPIRWCEDKFEYLKKMTSKLENIQYYTKPISLTMNHRRTQYFTQNICINEKKGLEKSLGLYILFDSIKKTIKEYTHFFCLYVIGSDAKN